MRITFHAATRWMAAAACAIAVGVASAQSPAVNKQEAADAKQQQTQQQAQPLNNQPVWSEIRSGQPQFTSIPGRETNVLIQPQGQTWRAARVPIATIGGFLFAFAFIVLAAFYLWRGPIRVKGAPSGRLIERFTLVERAVHWTVAITFTTLAATGLILTFGKTVLLPIIGYTLFSLLATLSKYLHNFVGPVLVIVLPVMIALFVHENIFRKYDWAWLKKGGGMLTGEHVPSGKANAGQKVLFWLLVVGCRRHARGDRAHPRLSQLQPDTRDHAGRQRHPHGRGCSRVLPAAGPRLPRHDRHEGRVGGDGDRICR